MRAHSLVAFTFVASALVACSVTPRDTEAVGESTQALLPRDREPVEPKEPLPPPPSHTCPSERVDLYRNAANCVMPPASSQGTWSMQPLFPNAPLAIRNRLCAYTWQPKDTPYTCAPPPHATITRTFPEKLGLRGHCPLGTSGCGTTTWVAYDQTTTFPGGVGTTGVLTMSTSSSGTSGTTQKQTSTGMTSSGGNTSGAIVAPAGGVGCCDACVEVQESYAYVVLPENTEFSNVTFDVPIEGGGSEHIEIENPNTNVIQVNLNPWRRYSSGMIWSLHTIE